MVSGCRAAWNSPCRIAPRSAWRRSSSSSSRRGDDAALPLARAVCDRFPGFRGGLRAVEHLGPGRARTAEPAMTWTCGAATDTGLLRDRNEDRFLADEARGVFLVVDGVGGA